MKYSIFLLAVVMFQVGARADFNASNCDTSILDNPQLTRETREHFMEPFDQVSTQLCYAHAAADLMSVVTGRSIAPLSLAILNFRGANESYDASSAGEIVNAIQVGNEGTPVCATSGFNSRGFSVQQLERPPAYNCAPASQVRVAPIGGTFYRDCLSGQTPRRVLPEAYKNRILAAINQELGAFYPVALSINLVQLAALKPGQQRISNAEGSEAHAVSLIGRKWINNRCEYVIRNSYGRDACASVISHDRATCTGVPGFPAGTFSLSEEVLKEALLRVFTMSRQSTSEIEVATPDICRPAAAAGISAAGASAAPAAQSESVSDDSQAGQAATDEAPEN